jgi:putative flippase GtrA
VPARPLRSPPGVSAQLGRFLAVGLSNTALSYVVYAALVEVVPYWIAGALAFAAGAVNGYVLNRRWTFAAPDSGGARLRYLAVQLGGLVAVTVLLRLLVSDAGVHRLWAYALAVPPVTAGSFLANRGWTFRARRSSRPARFSPQ